MGRPLAVLFPGISGDTGPFPVIYRLLFSVPRQLPVNCHRFIGTSNASLTRRTQHPYKKHKP